jgi:hypothetical protein
MKAAGLTEGELATLKGTSQCKLVLARLLWQRTTVSQGWLASQPAHEERRKRESGHPSFAREETREEEHASWL